MLPWTSLRGWWKSKRRRLGRAVRSLRCRIKAAKWWVQDLFSRRHVLKLGLRRGWVDADEVLLYAVFAVFERFMAEEWNLYLRHTEITPELQAFVNEVNELHHWWTVVRPGRRDGFNEVPEPLVKWLEGPFGTKVDQDTLSDHRLWDSAWRDSSALTQVWYNEDTDMMHRLIALRQHLWV